MQIQTNTDSSVSGDDQLAQRVETIVQDTLGHFTDRITRVEVHLSDVNRQKSGADDKHCTMEARITGHQPVAVSHKAETLQQAIDGAARKLKRSLSNTLGKLSSR